MRRGPGLIFLYVITAAVPVAVIALTRNTYYGFMSELGRSSAVTGFMLLIMQSLLAGRFRWITEPFGFDIVIRFHRDMALLAVLLIIAHPVLMAFGDSGFELLTSFDLPWYILLGKTVLVLVLVQAGISMFRLPDRLGFERWRALHDILAPLIILAAVVHSWKSGDDLRLFWMRALWVAAAGISLLAFFHHRFVRPALLRRHPFRVTVVEELTKGVWDVRLEPQDDRGTFEHLPGQFQFITFHRGRGLPEEEHHWTISSSPGTSGEYVTSTIKELGDFTSTIGSTRPGDTATVHAPFGRFSYLLHGDEEDLVFVAGGIGITPLMSMIRHMRDIGSKIPVLLVYANRDEDSITFRDELEEIERGGDPPIRIVHILNDPGGGWSGETGRLDSEKLREYCGGRFEGRGFYVCGPPGLVDSVVGALKGFGVHDRRIHIELFAFLD